MSGSGRKERDISRYLIDGTLGFEVFQDPLISTTVYKNRSVEEQIILNMLLFSGDGFIKMRSLKKVFTKVPSDAVKRLEELQILSVSSVSNEEFLYIQKSFRDNILAILIDPWTFFRSFGKSDHRNPQSAINERGQRKWGELLELVLNRIPSYEPYSSDRRSQADIDRLRILEDAGIVVNEETTDVGVNFLFKNRQDQLWMILDSMIQKRSRKERRSFIKFIFKISYTELGYRYDTRAFLDESEQPFLDAFVLLGLVVLDDSSGRHFYNTELCKGISRRMDAGQREGGLIIESNFKIYFKNPTEHEKALFGLFADVRYVLSDMIAGDLTRESMSRALSIGMDVDILLEFFEENLQEEMKKVSRISSDYHFPGVISEQIKIWESQRKRLTIWENMSLVSFDSEYEEDYFQAKEKLREAGKFFAADDKILSLVVKREDRHLVDLLSSMN